MPDLHSIQYNNLFSGAAYFIKGFPMLFRPELRKYVLIPLIVNSILFFTLTTLFIQYYDSLTGWDNNVLPTWLSYIETTLKWITWLLISAILIITYGYTFNIITNIIAAPFYGMLAQHTEALLTGKSLPNEPIYQMIPRTITREMKKLTYFIVRGVFVFLLIILLGTIPVLNILAPLIGLLWSAWSMSIQYSDYAADNNQVEFYVLRKILRKRIYSCIGFGGSVMGGSMIPVLNIITMPVAVISGTMFWVNELKNVNPKEENS